MNSVLCMKKEQRGQTYEFHHRANFLFFSEKKQQEIKDKERSGSDNILLIPCFFSISLQVIFNYIEYIMVYVTNKILNVESEMPHTCTADNAQSWHTCRFDTN